ncbi:ATP-binding protein [Streptomyces liangshanensis]|uniref:SpoIIE family protein phosphatase n=1 Tax=Streptomyces liangshanensis TaxID=2717324 RepID=A0A6G9H705_9ACTN|nr:SpoIIE family protein phosphatase [Streptomyces liangshanensis]QIQ05877.1 SpoIIE family protein phosphatase [Streptomyces liangshanensis]
MGPVNAGPLLVDCEDVAWFRDQPGAARGAAAALGRRTGLSEHRTAELVLAVAELVTNMTNHSVDASLLLRAIRTREVAGVEVVVVDHGPGMADVAASLLDGSSTSGTLGIGLGAVRRLADVFDIHSRPGHGTVQLARFWPRPLPRDVGDREPAVSGVTRPISGERVCGDAWATRLDPHRADSGTERAAPAARPAAAPDGAPSAPAVTDWAALTLARTSSPGTPLRSPAAGRSARSVPVRAAVAGPGPGIMVMLCDGLGHGPLASLAGQAAVQAFRTGTSRLPEQAVQEIHRALRGTRGAAVAVARIEPDGNRLLFCGVGNITAALVTATSRSNLLSHPGIVGHQIHPPRTYEHQLPAHGALIMHSDGLTERWAPEDLSGLFSHRAGVLATGLLRQAGTRRDDASVVIAKELW